MASVSLPVVGAAYSLTDVELDQQSCINFYPQTAESGGGISALLPSPGLFLLWHLFLPCRGLKTLESGDVLAVMGKYLYRLRDNMPPQLLGPLQIDGTAPVSMASNGQYVLLVSGDAGYVLDLATWIVSIESTLTMQADSVAFLAGRFVVNELDTGRIWWSGLYDTTVDPLAFATAEASPDNLVAVAVNNDNLWLFGASTAEIWYATGDKDLPFARMQGTYVQAGCIAAQSIAKMGSSVIWLASSQIGRGQVVMTEGYQPQRISTHAIESAIARYARIDDAYAFAYQDQGHGFYCLTFPTAAVTWVYDLTTQLWHQRSYWQNGRHYQHRARYHAMLGQKHLVSDHANGKLYQLSNESVTDDGALIVRERTCSAVGDGTLVRHGMVTLQAKTGAAGLVDREPVVGLSWSDDYGHSWSDLHLASLGAQGQYAKRLQWRRLGMSRHRIYRVTVSDPVRVTISGATLEVV